MGSDPCHMMWVVSRHPLPNTPKHTTSVFAPRDLFFYTVNPPFFLASRQVLIHTITPVPSNVGPRVGGTRYGPTRFGLGPARKHKFYLSLFAHMDWQQNYDQWFYGLTRSLVTFQIHGANSKQQQVRHGLCRNAARDTLSRYCERWFTSCRRTSVLLFGWGRVGVSNRRIEGDSYDIFTKGAGSFVDGADNPAALGTGHTCLKRSIVGINVFFLVRGH